MPNYYGYLRVSTEGQEVESQKLGLLEYANQRGFAPMEIVAETVTNRGKHDREHRPLNRADSRPR